MRACNNEVIMTLRCRFSTSRQTLMWIPDSFFSRLVKYDHIFTSVQLRRHNVFSNPLLCRNDINARSYCFTFCFVAVILHYIKKFYHHTFDNKRRSTA